MKIFKVVIVNLFIIHFVLGLSGCKVGPNYVRPPQDVPAHFKESKNSKVVKPIGFAGWKEATPKAICDRGEWWRLFQDDAGDHVRNDPG